MRRSEEGRAEQESAKETSRDADRLRRDLARRLRRLGRQGNAEPFFKPFRPWELRQLHYDFELWARDDQLPPAAAQGGGAWTIWLMLGGRGAGKTRAGAEWVRSIATAYKSNSSPLDTKCPRIALVGETLADARSAAWSRACRGCSTCIHQARGLTTSRRSGK